MSNTAYKPIPVITNPEDARRAIAKRDKLAERKAAAKKAENKTAEKTTEKKGK